MSNDFVRYLWNLLKAKDNSQFIFSPDGKIYRVDTSGQQAETTLVATLHSKYIK